MIFSNDGCPMPPSLALEKRGELVLDGAVRDNIQ